MRFSHPRARGVDAAGWLGFEECDGIVATDISIRLFSFCIHGLHIVACKERRALLVDVSQRMTHVRRNLKREGRRRDGSGSLTEGIGREADLEHVILRYPLALSRQ